MSCPAPSAKIRSVSSLESSTAMKLDSLFQPTPGSKELATVLAGYAAAIVAGAAIFLWGLPAGWL